MGLATQREIQRILKKKEGKPLKGLGQNFLINKLVIKQTIRAANLKKKDKILEIGPGIGVLTLELAKKVREVVTVEKDPKMVEALKDVLADHHVKNVKIISGDILRLPDTQYKILNTQYKVVANLPYYITAPVIRKFLEGGKPPSLMVLIIQKEVAQRICAKPPKMNLLALSVQFYSRPEIIGYVSKKSFWPKPKVDGAILRITPMYKNKKTNPGRFFKVARAGFSQPRKYLGNNLAKELKLNKTLDESQLISCVIGPNQRAETLSLEDWILLTKKFLV